MELVKGALSWVPDWVPNWIVAAPIVVAIFFGLVVFAERVKASSLNTRWRIREAVKRLPWKQRIACRWGFHPRNPDSDVPERAHFVTTCANGYLEWHEQCPRCARWHRERALDAKGGA